MDPPSSAAFLSSPFCGLRVNGAPPVPVRRLVRAVLRAERRIHAERPAAVAPAADAKPPRADQVLEQLARTFKPGDRVGSRTIVETCRIAPSAAGAIRRWAIAEGRWPYRKPVVGFGALAARKDGAA